jgi:hypothetical protein
MPDEKELALPPFPVPLTSLFPPFPVVTMMIGGVVVDEAPGVPLPPRLLPAVPLVPVFLSRVSTFVEVESVPVNVRVLEQESVFPSAIVSVDPVAGAVIVTLLRVVAVATPSVGVVRLGLVESTTEPLPVDVVTPVPPLPTAIAVEKVCAPVNVCAASVRASVEDVAGNACDVLSVPVNVSVFEQANVFPSAIVSVLPVVGVVIVTLLIVVALATPSVGVTSDGLDDKTSVLPVPVVVLPSSVVDAEYACTLTPIARPRFVRAVAASVAPVPPFAIGNG